MEEKKVDMSKKLSIFEYGLQINVFSIRTHTHTHMHVCTHVHHVHLHYVQVHTFCQVVLIIMFWVFVNVCVSDCVFVRVCMRACDVYLQNRRKFQSISLCVSAKRVSGMRV